MTTDHLNDYRLEELSKLIDTLSEKENIQELTIYFFTLFFIKIISDQLNHPEIKLQGAINLIDVPVESNFYYLNKKLDDSHFGDIFKTALKKLEQANQISLKNFSDFIFHLSKSPRILLIKNIFNILNSPFFDFYASDKIFQDNIGFVFESLALRFLKNHTNIYGEFLFSNEISILLARVIAPQCGDSICNPFAGIGSIFFSIARENPGIKLNYVGQEKNKQKLVLCQMAMILNGIYNSDLELRDPIINPVFDKNGNLKKYDIVISIPPFLQTIEDYQYYNIQSDCRFWRGLPPKSPLDYFSITHMVEIAQERSGKIGIIVPIGILFRGGLEGQIRRKFVEENIIEAVIGLPPQLFSDIHTNFVVLILNKSRLPWNKNNSKKNNHILFIDASKEYQKGRGQNKLRIEDIDKLTSAYKNFDSVKNYSHLATFEEVAAQDFNLNISGFIPPAKDDTNIDISAVHTKIKLLEDELKITQSKLDKYIKELREGN